MKRLLLLPLVLLASGAALGQSAAPPCNNFDASGVPVLAASPYPAAASTPYNYNCTDYFGSGNWANSPLPSSPITGFTLIAGGSGYSNPVVVIDDPTGTGATGTATATAGVVTAVAVGAGGAGYVVPKVYLVDVGVGGTLAAPTCGGAGQPACGAGAMASAVLGGPYTGGMLKFQDAFRDLKSVIAIPDTTTFPGSDYYEIALVQFTQKMHASLPPTTLRGYEQLPSGSSGCGAVPLVAPSYLGPTIVAVKDRPVRVKFTNCLPAGLGGNLFIPTDTTYMGAGMGPDGTAYTQNRAELHLHGGATPWISDGTPHQWTVPVGETASLQKGLGVAYVPDMYYVGGVVVPQCSATVTTGCSPSALPAGAANDPGQGALTYYWTNQQGARLMFYHDHAYGLTRLNVYAGEAAGYLLVDPTEEDKLAAATVPGTMGTAPDPAHLIPLVIQDKTFVPSAAQINAQDPTWAANFGTTPGAANLGDLWFPHVYSTNQNPADAIGGANGFGHWDYGPWFFPPQTSLTAATPPTAVTVPCTSAAFPGQLLEPTLACPTCGCPIFPNPSGTPEGFMDTPVVNGVAYPVLHVAPEAYRFRILSVGNDRSQNLSWFVADPLQGNTEVAMVPAAPPLKGATVLPLCTAINPVAVPGLVIGLATALLDATGNPMNGTGLPANCWPNFGPQPGIPAPQTMWAADGRVGGVPDPRTAGPPWIQIGSEGGLLPAPVVIPAVPVNYEQNVRSITIGSVAVHGLWLGPAERADVVVDFSKFAGKTLILYNDAPTPAPANDSRVDYFTDDGDQVPIGGAPNTPAGYGPNTRTIMQVIVDAAPTSTVPFNLGTLKAAFASTATTQGIFATTQPKTIVPEPVYNSAYNGTFPTVQMGIQNDSLTFTPLAPLTFDRPCAATAPAQCGVLGQKAIQELFTLDYGRMNATLGTELPLTNFLTQTTIPYGYAEWGTEFTQGGQTALWKITHNGVDSHFIHFHLFNVQVVNRVGWDGSLRPIDANEAGWKETVRMNPLEDILVALQPITPVVPFPLPDSIRPIDVTMPVGTPNDPTLSGIDPATGNAIVPASAGTTNALVNFGWEYVWHCHILGHEENDMMRPIVHQVAPPAPSSLLAAAPTPTVLAAVLTWMDNSASETSFTVQRDTVPTFDSAALTTWKVDGTTVDAQGFNTLTYAQTVTFKDPTVVDGATYFYRVRSDDSFAPYSPLAGVFQSVPLSSGWSNIASLNAALLTPSVTFTGAPASAAYNATFTVTATTNSSSLPSIAGTSGVCSVGAVAGTPASATATVTMTSGTGTCALTATWAPDSFFTGATATQTTNATLAAPTVTFTGAPPTAVYLSTFTVTATTNAAVAPTITGNAVCSAGPVTGTSPATALITMNSGTGTCALTASWPATTNYALASLTQNTTAALAAPVITWASPAAIVYGTALSATQLNATAAYNGNPVPGTFAYTPPAGTVLPVGSQTLSVTFTPTDTASFSPATKTVTLAVTPAPLTITALTTTMIYGGPVPAITPAYTGFVNNDTAATAFTTLPVCATTATSASPASPPTYPSSCTGAVAPNYGISYVAGAVTITKAATTATITSSLPSPSIRGQIVTFGFSVTTKYSGVPSGSVQLTASSGESCTATLTAGAGSCAMTFLSGGSRTVTATYGGDANFLGSVSAAVTQIVSSVDLSTTALLFGNQILNTTSASQAVTLTNVGTLPLALSSIAAKGDFAQNNNCPVGGTLGAGRSCRINVTFRPTVLGVQTSALTIVDADPTSPQIVTLTGTGVAPAAVLSPTSYAFGTIPRGTSATFAFTLSNPGTAPLRIYGISMSGFTTTRFTQTNNCGTNLGIGASCTINVTFSSNSAGSFSSTLTVNDNAPGGTQTARVTGTAQ